MKELQKLWYIPICLLTLLMYGCGCGGEETTVTLVPVSATLVSIEVATGNISIPLGTNHQFTATGVYTDNSRQNITDSVTWSSSDAAIADISNEVGAKGLSVSHAIGSVKITATYGSISGFTTLTVTKAGANIVSINVTPANKTVQRQSNLQYSATGTFSDNTTQDITKSVTWSSSNISVATISDATDSKGLATAVAAGTSTISATIGGLSGSTSLTVTSVNLVSIMISPKNAMLGANKTLQYTAIGTFSDNTTRDITTEVTWSSSDTSLVSISNNTGSNGLATRNNNMFFFVTITATLGNISDSTILIDP